MSENTTQKPSALLLIATGCQHCPTMLKHLADLIKEGQLASLEVVNIVNAPERAQALKVRSVPWLKLGEFELTGMRSRGELEEWIQKAETALQNPSAEDEDMSAYFQELMTSGEISKVQSLIEEKPAQLSSLLSIITDEKAGLSAKIGVGAVLESLQGTDILADQVEALGQLCQHKSPQIRNDACYYLGLSHSDKAIAFLQPLLNDTNEDVKEAAQEALDNIKSDDIKEA